MSTEWRRTTLGEVARVRKGDAIASSSVVPGPFPVVSAGVRPTLFHDKCNRPGPTITVSASGNAGYVAYWNGPIFASDCLTISEVSSDCSMRFVYYVMKAAQAEISALKHGSVQSHVYSRDLSSLAVSLPTRDVQDAIVGILSCVDGAIGDTDLLVEKKTAVKQACMQRLLAGKTRLHGFEGRFVERRIGDIAWIDPDNLSGNTDPELSFNYIALGDVDVGRLHNYTMMAFKSAPSRARRILRNLDILLATVRPYLLGHLLYDGQIDNAVASTGFAVLRCRPRLVDPGFLYYHLFGDIVNQQIDTLLTGSNYPAINSSDVRLIRVPCPPTVEEQRAIATVLADMDGEILALERYGTKMRRIKEGLMQQLLAGRICVAGPEVLGPVHESQVGYPKTRAGTRPAATPGPNPGTAQHVAESRDHPAYWFDQGRALGGAEVTPGDTRQRRS